MGVDKHSLQQGALLLVGGCVQGGQDEGLGGLQGIFEGIQGRYEDRGPFSLGTAGAAIAMFRGQARQARDGVEVGLMGAQPGEGAKGGQGRQHREPGRKSRRRQCTTDQLHFFYFSGPGFYIQFSFPTNSNIEKLLMISEHTHTQQTHTRSVILVLYKARYLIWPYIGPRIYIYICY